MEKEKFSKIVKMLKEESSNAGGPIIKKERQDHFLDLRNLSVENTRRDVIIHLEYFPEQNRYGFAIYKGEKK